MIARRKNPSTAARAKPTPRSRAMRALLFLVVLVWHAALLFLLRPATRADAPRPLASARPTVMAMSQTEIGPMPPAELRALWAPVLLSLPSSIGFSAPLGSAPQRTPPAFDLPREELQFLSRGGTNLSAARDPARTAHALDALATARLSRPLAPPPILAEPLALTPPRPQLPHLLFLHGADAEDVETNPWPPAIAERQSRAWEAVIQAWADDEGNIQEVLLESRTEDRDLNAALVRAVQGWSLAPSASTNWMRVRVRSFGAPYATAQGAAP